MELVQSYIAFFAILYSSTHVPILDHAMRVSQNAPYT